MSKTNAFETNFLLLLFNNTAIANIGDASGLQPSAADGDLFCSLHTADPGEAGVQTTSEAAYTSYARAAVPRTAGGWTVAGDNASNTAIVQWPQATGGSETETHYGIGTAVSGAGNLLASGALTASLAVSNGIQPEAAIGALTWTEA